MIGRGAKAAADHHHQHPVGRFRALERGEERPDAGVEVGQREGW